MANPAPGLVGAWRLDGRGGAQRVEWKEVNRWSPGSDTLWVHLNCGTDEAAVWLRNDSGLDATVAEALLAEETRPRSVATHGGLLVILRGANLNEGSDPEDMVAIRIWLEPGRIITARRRVIQSVEDLRRALDAGAGPTDPGDFLVALTDALTARLGSVLADFDDQVDGLPDSWA